MARALRIAQPGVWYHVTARGNERKSIFRGARDRGHFKEVMVETIERFGLLLQGWVLMDIGGSLKRQRRAYKEYVESAAREGLQASPWKDLFGQVLLGSEAFLEQMQSRLAGHVQEQPSLRQLQKRVDWNEVVAAVERIKGGPWSWFRDRHGDWGRDLALYLGRKHCGLGLTELGESVGGLDYRTVSWAISRFGQRLSKDQKLAALAKKATRQIQNPEICPR